MKLTDEQAQHVTVNTVEELEALPIGSRIEYQDVYGLHLAYKRPSGLWDRGLSVFSADRIKDDLPATVLTPATRPSDDAENPPNGTAADWHEAHRRWPFTEDETDTGCNRARRWAFVQGARWAAPTPQTPDDAGGLNALATTIRKVNNANGWTATDSTPTATIAVLALIMTEVAEAIEEVRNNAGDESRYRHAGGCAVSDWRMYGSAVGDSEPGCTCTPKPEGLPSEVADIIIRSLDFCASRGIDIDKAVAEKVAYNRTRSHRHGGKAL